jgi:hypothetical protein
MHINREKFIPKCTRPMSLCGPTRLGPIRFCPRPLYISAPDEPRVLLLPPLSRRLARAAAAVAAVTVTSNRRKVRAL